jgi:hypothetical protein
MGRPKREQRFRVTRYRYASGKQSWRVSGTAITGQRVRENFSSKADALERLNVLEHENGSTSQAAVPVLQRTSLSAEQIADAESALAILPDPSLSAMAANYRRWEDHCQSIGLTVDEALAFCSSRYHPELKEMSILQARDLFLASRRNVRPKTRKHYESATQRLLKKDPNRLVHQFTVSDLESLLDPFSKPSSFDVASLASACGDFTGAEIESAFVDAMHEAFAEGCEPAVKHVREAITRTVPLARLMDGTIESLRKWAKGRAREAAKPAVKTSRPARRIHGPN